MRALLALIAASAAALAPASASAADPSCPQATTLTPAYTFEEVETRVPLVATHELTVIAEFSEAVRGVALSVPDGVRVVGRRAERLKLIVPLSAALPVTATWVQATDPSDPSSSPDDPETRCVATATTALPVTATRPSRGFYLRKAEVPDAYSAIAVAPDPKRGDLSPMEVSIRVAASTRFPAANAKQRKLPVAMRPSERVRYKRHIPQEEFATSPLRCRYYNLTCGGRALVASWATALLWRPPGRPITERNLRGGALLSYVQPFRKVAPYGVLVDALIGGRGDYKPPASAYDIQVRQSGKLVGRARVAVRCGKERTQFGEYFYRCHSVRQRFG
jgi:hypothetical protein